MTYSRSRAGWKNEIRASESQNLAACLRLLYAWGLQPIRNNTGGFSKPYTNKQGVTKTHHVKVGKKGSGDILVCGRNGNWVEIECKRTGGKQELDQQERQRHVESMGGVYILARCVEDLEQRKAEVVG